MCRTVWVMCVLFVSMGAISWSQGETASQAEREMTFKKQYLNLPVKQGSKKCRMSITIDGKIVREFTIKLADSKPDFWVFLDLSEFKGKKATLKIDLADKKNPLSEAPKGLDMIYQGDEIRDAETFYKEKNRQQFHFSSQRGWNNDSNGLVYHKGEYHLYYQHNPYGWAWGNMHWAHAVSTDMVHWKELPIAIYPHQFGDWVFSGSAVVDKDNTAGFKTGKEDVIVAAYTSTGRGEAIAYSNDLGRTFTDYSGNPVVKHKGRDPKVIWYEPGKHWVMALYSTIDKKRTIAFYTSDNLKDWTYQSNVPGFFECPEIFELPVDGDKSNAKWVIYAANGEYMIGAFDGKTFTSDGDKIPFNYGNCFYASQTFNNIPDEDGRRIQIAWGRIKTPGMPFNQCMLFPVNLTLRTTKAGIRMCAKPIKEIGTIHGQKFSQRKIVLGPDKNPLAALSGELFHIKTKITVGSAKQFGFVIRGTEVLCDMDKGQLSCGDKTAPLTAIDGKLYLELVIDRNSIEIYANGGEIYMPIGGILPAENKTLSMFSREGQTKIDSLRVWKLKSIWR